MLVKAAPGDDQFRTGCRNLNGNVSMDFQVSGISYLRQLNENSMIHAKLYVKQTKVYMV